MILKSNCTRAWRWVASVGWVFPKPLLFGSSDSHRAVLAPDVVEGMFPRTASESPLRDEKQNTQIQWEKKFFLSVVDRQAAMLEFVMQNKNTDPGEED